VLRDVPPPARVEAARSDFEKRHEERFRGVQFDWLNFQRDGGAFPVPNSSDPYVSPPQELFVSATNGGGERQLTRLALRPTGVAWTHDSRAIVFGGDSTYRNELKYGADQIYSVSVDGAVRRLTTSNEHNHTGISLSPDRRTMLFTKQLSTDAVIAQKLNHGGARDLVVMPVEGGRETNLTADWDLLPTGARWSPDGRYIYFTGAVGGSTHLFRVASTGGPVQQITTGERRINGIQFDSAMTMMVYTVGKIEAPPEIHVARIDGSNERQLTRVHEPFTNNVALSRAERLQFRSRDGTEVEGL
jgi:dipeptidyl aminopeptidase/acylaminoacyl peptidase